MIEFKNRLTGTLMAVAPEREAEYLAVGHTRVVDTPAAPEKAPAAPEKAPAAKAPRPAAKKSTAKK